MDGVVVVVREAEPVAPDCVTLESWVAEAVSLCCCGVDGRRHCSISTPGLC